MRVLVTGADGFVGRHLCRALEARGDKVWAAGGPGGTRALEITSQFEVSRCVSEFKPESIIHLAGVSSVARSHAAPSEAVCINVLGAAHLLDAVRGHVPKARLLLIGSGEEYGRLEEGHPADENRPLAPLSPYAASKAAAEMLGRQAFASYGTEVLFLRPFNHLGAGQAPGFVVPSFAAQLVKIRKGQSAPVIEVGDLSPVRDFTHVLDVVDAYLLLLSHGNPGEAYNICSGTGWSIRQMLDTLQDLAGTRVEIKVDVARLRPAEIPWLVGTPSRAEALGWGRRRTVEQALGEALAEANA
jgi:GDP-4-dehydro-6-deoxy-D-mannose reductase